MGIFTTGPSDKTAKVSPHEALAGRDRPIVPSRPHLVLGTSLVSPYPDGSESAIVAMGCFWGAERVFWDMPGILTTAVGYCGGYTPNPTYEEVCTGRTGHAEAVLAVFDPSRLSYQEILAVFFERHDPTQGMRQGNDVGTQYRSAIFTTTPDQLRQATAARQAYQDALVAAGKSSVTTEIAPAGPFYFAEDYHQQYLAANPWGYCGLGGTGVCFPPAPARPAG